MCSLQDSGLARCCSLSLSAWLPSAAPDHGRAAAADFFFANLGGGAAAAGLVGDGATGSTATTAGSRQHDDGLRTCARSKDSGLARWCSLSLSAWLPSAAPDHGRAAAADFFFANLGGGAAAAGLVGDGATGSTATTAGSRQHDDGLRTCARSKIPGWRVAALYPLARGCRAPRRIMVAPPRPISFLRIWVAAPLQLAWSVTELRGRRRRPPDRASMMMAFGRVLAPKIPGWRVGALYPLARGCRAPRRIMAAPPRPISFLRIWVAAPLQLAWSVTELRGRRRRPPDRASMMMAFGRVLAPRFRAGALLLFIP